MACISLTINASTLPPSPARITPNHSFSSGEFSDLFPEESVS